MRAQEIASTVESSMVERKELATRTKEFRKLPDEHKVDQFKSLLKLYQGGIDTLTHRAKGVEATLLHLCKVLGDAPDPVPLLQGALESMILSERAIQLETENKDLSEQLARCRDYDALRSKLADAEQALVKNSDDKAASKLLQAQAEHEEKEKHWADRELSLNTQLKEMRDTLKELQADRKVEARLNRTAEGEKSAAGQLAELDIVSKDLARTEARLQQMEQRNADLRRENAALIGGSEKEAKAAIEHLAAQLGASKAEADHLSAKINRDATEHRQTVSQLRAQLDHSKAQNVAQTSTLRGLESRVASMHDYDELKRELDLLKRIEFSIQDDDLASETNDQAGDKSDESSLERLLVLRNHKLNDSLVQKRNMISDLQAKLENTTNEFNLAKVELDEHRKLIEKLEGDLTRVNDHVASAGSAYSPSIAPSRYASRPRKSGRNLSPTTSIVGLPREADMITSLGRTVSGQQTQAPQQQAEADAANILAIVTQQRDRFRAKNGELEEELRKQLSSASQLRAELQSLKRDNVQLYERSRYMSSYAAGKVKDDTVIQLGEFAAPASTKTYDRYRSVYEADMNPFQRFKARESARAIRGMNILEKGLLNVMRYTLSNKLSRTIFGLYFLAIHIFLIIVSIKLAGIPPPASRLRYSGPHDAFG
ncbi:hypothetical protein PYCC9005_001023 [Savitreella phatthalungensis]